MQARRVMKDGTDSPKSEEMNCAGQRTTMWPLHANQERQQQLSGYAGQWRRGHDHYNVTTTTAVSTVYEDTTISSILFRIQRNGNQQHNNNLLMMRSCITGNYNPRYRRKDTFVYRSMKTTVQGLYLLADEEDESWPLYTVDEGWSHGETDSSFVGLNELLQGKRFIYSADPW